MVTDNGYYYKITIDKEVYEKEFEQEVDAYNFALTKYGYIISDKTINDNIFTSIIIEPLEDTWECDDCGTDYAIGAKVFIDGVQVIDLVPIAHCYDGVSYDDEYIYNAIINHLNLPINVELEEREFV